MGRRPYPSFYTSHDGEAADITCGFIHRTTQTIDFLMYALTDPRVAKELIEAHQRGIRVRGVVDKLQAAGRYSKVEQLREAGIEVREDSQEGSMHHKLAICDIDVWTLRAVLSGSYNWTESAAKRNDENAVILRNKEECDKAQTEFNRLWALNALQPDN